MRGLRQDPQTPLRLGMAGAIVSRQILRPLLHIRSMGAHARRDRLSGRSRCARGSRRSRHRDPAAYGYASRRTRPGRLVSRRFASFLGATTVKAKGLHGFSWAALVALVLGLVISAVLLSNWKLRFAIDAPDFYAELYDEAASEAETDTLGWLVSAAYGYHNLRRANASRVRIMGGLLTALGVLMVLQTLFWLIALR
jgi:hypothetical protein